MLAYFLHISAYTYIFGHICAFFPIACIFLQTPLFSFRFHTYLCILIHIYCIFPHFLAHFLHLFHFLHINCILHAYSHMLLHVFSISMHIT
jgi:hypothetical protein